MSRITKPFDRHVRDLEKVEFPEFLKEDIYAPPNNPHMYFAPSWHFRDELLTKEIVDDLKANHKDILSIGSGPAHLERLLVKIFGVSAEQIVLSDKDQVMSNRFEQYRFNMYEQWPNFSREFDYVIFPESVLLNCRFNNDLDLQNGLYHILDNALRTTKQRGQIRMNGHCQREENIESVRERLSTAYPNSKLSYNHNLIIVS